MTPHYTGVTVVETSRGLWPIPTAGRNSALEGRELSYGHFRNTFE
ncbi:hypothetical protein SCATT_01710 [Streptantibioticus cattleyicolor NRRL 8057 = DSM 46488]|uniref:Uncharacterized protein n=1 Tax=Streptantibioticus cattleyicolor (strain ATCC 35852 / DSM 46488 / JCM 4925 / NBRC 14057 / NRRL 8057) TaxID=1003195 RepID=F8K342_STREN|nr:hypothetical protein SCATT_01710 [Streptantibioticus cattleyicolor NRRL 8057 = DSM 46488]CCB72900.1 protein of unknown function [Streptantibioticus cattleyicolor NRRL 8057 = DSM 46488]